MPSKSTAFPGPTIVFLSLDDYLRSTLPSRSKGGTITKLHANLAKSFVWNKHDFGVWDHSPIHFGSRFCAKPFILNNLTHNIWTLHLDLLIHGSIYSHSFHLPNFGTCIANGRTYCSCPNSLPGLHAECVWQEAELAQCSSVSLSYIARFDYTKSNI